MDSRPPSTAAVWTSEERTRSLRRDADRQSRASQEESEELLRAALIAPGMHVLDVACGPGDPTLDIARRVGETGQVVGVDLSDGALEVARERASREKLRNAEFRAANAESLPFADGAFDRVVCRFGAMFFEDLEKACREMHRVLRTSGRSALMVWGPFDQPYFQGTIGIVLRHLGLSEPPVDKRVPFRFAGVGSLEGALTAAGFSDVIGETPSVNWVWDGTPEDLRDNWRDGAVFWRPQIDQLPDAAHSPVWAEIAEFYRRFYDGRVLRVPLNLRIITGRKA